MFRFFYNLLSLVGLLVLSPAWLCYLALTPKARHGFFQKVGLYPPELKNKVAQQPGKQPRLWLHAVSVGEFNALRPLIEQLQQVPINLVISTTTQTSQTLAQKTFPTLPVFYFPFDFGPCIQAAFRLLRPDAIAIAETELWPNLILSARQQHIPVVLVNGRISEASFKGYQLIRPMLGPVLRQLKHAYMQSAQSAERLLALGANPDQVSVCGNLKFDIHPTVDGLQKDILRNLFGLTPKDSVLVLASTHAGEEAPLVEVYLKLKKDFPELKLILAPRHPERAGEIRTLLSNKSMRFVLRSQLDEAHLNREDVMVLDSIGELLTVYSLSTVAVIGGSCVPHGGHNPLEAMSQGVPVVMGPHMFNFADMTRVILENRAGYQVQSPEQLLDVLTELLTQPQVSSHVVENAHLVLQANRGALNTLLSALKALLNQVN